MARNLSNRTRREIRSKKEILAKIAALAICERNNLEQIELRVRKHVVADVEHKRYVDPKKERRLYKLPGLPQIDADYLMRNSEFRVCAQDGLKLY